MKPIHLLAGLLAALSVLLDLVVLSGFGSGYALPLTLLAGLAFGQTALLTCWCVAGRGLLGVRLLVTLVGTYGLSRALGTVTSGSDANWLTLLSVFAGGLAGSLLIGRAFGIHLAWPTPHKSMSGVAARDGVERWKQFTLGSLLSLMTIVGMAIAIGRRWSLPQGQTLAVASCELWLILVSLTTLWMLASPGVWINRWLCLVAVCLLSSGCMAQTDPTFGMWFFTHIALIAAATICCGITLLQTAVQDPITQIE
jgi:hypothetical protein